MVPQMCVPRLIRVGATAVAMLWAILSACLTYSDGVRCVCPGIVQVRLADSLADSLFHGGCS